MIVHLTELPQGRSPLSFTLPVEQVSDYLRDVDVLYVQADEDTQVALQIDRFRDNLEVRGQLQVAYTFHCARCYEERHAHSLVELRWTLLPHASLQTHRLSEEEELELSTDDLDVSFYEGQEISFGELVREAILLEMETAPRCAEDACDLAAATSEAEENEEQATDPRWAALADLKKKLAQS